MAAYKIYRKNFLEGFQIFFLSRTFLISPILKISPPNIEIYTIYDISSERGGGLEKIRWWPPHRR